MKRYPTRLCAVAATLVLAGIAATSAPAAIKIAKIYYDSPGADTGSNSSLNDEWIRIRNTFSTARSLTGWRIRDASGHVYRFGTYTLPGGSAVTVHTGRGTNTIRHRYWRSDNYIWNNDRDTATLKNAAGVVKDRCSYNSTAVDYKVC
jgi:hypothetical protein